MILTTLGMAWANNLQPNGIQFEQTSLFVRQPWNLSAISVNWNGLDVIVSVDSGLSTIARLLTGIQKRAHQSFALGMCALNSNSLALSVQDIPIFKDRADWPLSQWEADFWFTDHVSKQASIFKMADEGRTERWFPEVLLCYLWGIFWEFEVILSLNRIFWASPVFSNPHLPHKSNTKDGHGSDKTCTRIKHLISIKVLLKCRQIAG